jgi:anti-sigma regulatory factor (Ser/Thr protein kinase)
MKKKFLTNKNLLSEVHAWVKECLTQQATEDQFLTVIIVVNEIIQNIYRYTYHLEKDQPIIIEIKYNGLLQLEVRDYGTPCHDQSFLDEETKISETGGMGLKIIIENTVDFTIQPLDDGNITSFSFNLSKTSS